MSRTLICRLGRTELGAAAGQDDAGIGPIAQAPSSRPHRPGHGALHMSRAEIEQGARLAMAAKLTSGQAARLVGMARVAFLSELGRLGVSAIQVEPDALVQDLAAAGHHPQQQPAPSPTACFDVLDHQPNLHG